jgi:hypothetical protein
MSKILLEYATASGTDWTFEMKSRLEQNKGWPMKNPKEERPKDGIGAQ